MKLLRRLFQRLVGWAGRRTAQPEPDAADFGTSYGLEMSMLPASDAPTRPHRID